MKKQLSILLFSLLAWFGALAQDITGENRPIEGLTYVYTLDASVAANFSSSPGTWQVLGGSITSQNADPANGAVTVTIHWDYSTSANALATGDIAYGNTQFTYYNRVKIMDAAEAIRNCTRVIPELQVMDYQQTPQVLHFDNCNLPAQVTQGSITYQWQRCSPPLTLSSQAAYDYLENNSHWQNIPGATANTYAPGALTDIRNQYYRCIIQANVAVAGVPKGARSQFTTNRVLVQLPALDPGKLLYNGVVPRSALQLPFNQQLAGLTQSPAFGGLCTARTYTWEVSYNHAAWSALSTAEMLPQSLWPVVAGHVRLRRRVECATDVLYTNTLEFDVNYTSPWVESKNYIRVNEVIVPGVQTWPAADALSIGEKLQSTTYFDGLGRAIQQVSKETSQDESNPAAWKDMVAIQQYDAAGRSENSYLPYPSNQAIGFFKETALNEQAEVLRVYYSDPNANTFANTKLEKSPLGRPLETTMPGSAWAGTSVKAAYKYNTTQDGVRIWEVGNVAGALPVTTGIYADGMLQKSESTDEKNKRVLSYTDREGHLVLKKVQLDNTAADNSYDGWLSTYYIYNDMGLQRFVVPPVAVNYLRSQQWSNAAFTPALAAEQCFYYLYDQEGRVTVKHTPGAGEIHLVYDKRDRLILSQDARQAGKSEWAFNLYDALDRPVVSGLLQNGDDRRTLQNLADQSTEAPEAVTLYTDQSETVNTFNPVVSILGTCLTCPNDVVINTVDYYDGYNAPVVQAPVNLEPPAQMDIPHPDNQPVTARANGLHTVSKHRRILDDGSVNGNTGHYLLSTYYYDEHGRFSQSLAQNVLGGVDVHGLWYDFSGTVGGSTVLHRNPLNTNVPEFKVFTAHTHDRLLRVTSQKRSFLGNYNWKVLSRVQYDAFGRVKQKVLSPGYNNGNGLETQDYSYNLHGWLTGINKDYAESSSDAAQWDRYFGVSLGYAGNNFTNKQYNGQLSGQRWRTQGENTVRRYNYTYDNAGRFTGATYDQLDRPSQAFWNTATDYGMQLNYDANGNISTLTRYGLLPGTGSQKIDELDYTYRTATGNVPTNQLVDVYDHQAVNHRLGDFTNGTHTGNDYSYDANGNLEQDKNRGITGPGITWNYLDKAFRISKPGKSTTEIWYDADGTRLQKKVTDAATGHYTLTSYVKDFVYEYSSQTQQTRLQYIRFGDGRVRLIESKNTFGSQVPSVEISGELPLHGNDPEQLVYDFFVKDQQGNTRMVLTEEVHRELHVCSMETANGSTQQYEETTFGAVDATGNPVSGNEVQATRTPVQSSGWDCNHSDWASRLWVPYGGAAHIGPNLLLKVMAGDLLHAQTQYFYDPGRYGNQQETLKPLVQVLSNLLSNSPLVGSAIHQEVGNITSNLSQSGSSIMNFLNEPADNVSMPKAGLYVLFFDERFQFVTAEFKQIEQEGNQCEPLVLQSIQVPQNGYAMVLVANQQENALVLFDDLKVNHERGRLLEENHYYPDGLKMAAICARSMGKLPNRYGYQGDYSEEDAETGYQEFDLRMYDPQIGRWISPDPYDQFASPYVGMGADPVNNVDPDGGLAGSSLMDVVVTSTSHASSAVFSSVLGSIGSLASNFGLDDWIRGKDRKIIFSPLQNQEQVDLVYGKDRYTYLGKEGYEINEATGDLNLYGADGVVRIGKRTLPDIVLGGKKTKLIGEAKGISAFIPFYASGRDLINAIQQGDWGGAAFNGAMFISDAFLIKSVATGLAKGGIKAMFKAGAGTVGKEVVEEGAEEGAKTLFKDITKGGAKKALEKGKVLNYLLDIHPNEFVKNLAVPFKQAGKVWMAEKNGLRYVLRNEALTHSAGATVDVFKGAEQLYKYRFTNFFTP